MGNRVDLQFIGQNVHFAISLLAALSSFAVFWLIFDAWLERRDWREAIKWLGFLVLAIGLLLSGAVTDNINLVQGFLGSTLSEISTGLRFAGYALIALGQILEPLMERPHYTEDPETGETKVSAVAAVGSSAIAKLVLMPLLAFVVGGLYLRRATTGLERHLRQVFYGFVAFGFYELFSALGAWQSSTNPLVYRWVENYGLIWWLAQVCLALGGVILGRWVWQYLTKRLLSEIFIVLITATVVIYFVSTGAFSFLLLRNTKAQALDDLSTASSVLDYAITSRQAEAAAQAEAIAAQTTVANAAAISDHKATQTAVGSFAAAHQLSSLIVTDANGRVLLRSEDPDRWGDSVSSNTLVQRAVIGRAATSVTVKQGVVAPSVSLVASRPVRDQNGVIVGTVVVAKAISSAFVDGIHAATGLQSTVYGSDQRAATTLTSADGLHRAIGLKETDSKVLSKVLNKGKDYSGEVDFANRPYLAGYTPLKDADKNTVGMLLVARPADVLLATAAKSVELAFLIAVCLLLISIVPVYLVAKKISGEVR